MAFSSRFYQDSGRPSPHQYPTGTPVSLADIY